MGGGEGWTCRDPLGLWFRGTSKQTSRVFQEAQDLGGRHFCHLIPLDTPVLLGIGAAPLGPQSWPGLGLDPIPFPASPTAPTLTAAVPTGTATRIPPASTRLMSQRRQVA